MLSAGALVACASIAVGCGVIPGATGGSGDDPITVMTWAPENTAATNKPGMPAMAKAYARWVNAKGGINGHKLNVLTCNDHNDSVDAADCARRAVKENVVAVVGSYSQHGRSFLAPLEGAGIPYIGGYGVTDDEFTSPLSYPVNGGEPALLAGLGEQLGKTCGPVSLIRPDTIAGDELPVLLDSGLKAAGHTSAIDQRAAEDATEYSEQTQTALRARDVRSGRRRVAWCPRSATARTPSWTPSGATARTTRRCGRGHGPRQRRPVGHRLHRRHVEPVRRRVRHRLVPGGERPALGRRCAR